MKLKDFFEITGNSIMYVLTFTNTKELFEIISLILSIIISLLIIVSKLWTWYNKVKSDGKISKEEINEGVEIAKKGIEVIKEGKEQIEKKINSKKED